ncbi:MAG: ATP-binding protein [Gordonia sp. (in: high G+C Gram-positive bacteria)]|uniref:sensor histidine kinase n=1 Tax=Gordonia TaxID=2053 RepID=UPI0032639FE1
MVTRSFVKQFRPLPVSPESGRKLFDRADLRDSRERDRVVVLLARFVGIGYFVYAVIVLPQMVVEADDLLPAWYPPTAALLAFGPGIGILAASFVRRWQRHIRAMVIACVAGLLAAGVLWLLVARGESTTAATWILDFAGLAGVTLVLVRPVWEAIVAVTASKLLGAAVAVANVSDANVWAAVQEALFGIVFSTVCILLASRVLVIGDALDTSRAHTERLVARGVANVELARMDALIHDHVLATFVAAAADRDDPRVVDQAQGALHALGRLLDDEGGSDCRIPGHEVVLRLRAVIAEQGADVPVTVEVTDDAVDCPVDVVAALSEAAAEAIRNSAVHAGGRAQRAVFLGVGRDLVQVVIADDGVGFDPATVPADRLGLALSIRHRIGALPGGEAAVVSAPGAGTTVRLRWRPDPRDRAS